jgi:arylsulfatase A-like enzyme
MKAKKAGYKTGYVGKWHASYLRPPQAFGYDEIGAPDAYNPKVLEKLDYTDERKKTGLKVVDERRCRWPGLKPEDKEYLFWSILDGEEDYTDEWGVAETGIKMMKKFATGQNPWLLEIHFEKPVWIAPLKKYADRYDPASIPVPDSFNDTFNNKPNIYKRDRETYGPTTPKDYQETKAYYYANCEQIDVQIGRILDALEQTGQVENTVVVCTTDHGNMHGDHGIWHMGVLPYEETYRIPMVIRWPGKIKPASVSDRLVISHDLAHTYVDIMGQSPLPFADARSLLPLFEQPDRSDWRDAVLNTFYGGEFLYTQRIVVTENFKYVFNGFDYDECYDLENDPGEMVNLIHDPDYGEIVDDMRARLYELMNQFEDPYGDTQNRICPGKPPNRYCASRYLPRGKRMLKQ